MLELSGFNFKDLSIHSGPAGKPAGALHGVLLHGRPILDLNRMVNMNDISCRLVENDVAARSRDNPTVR